MIVANVSVSIGLYHESRHSVGYSDLQQARADYERVVALMKRRREQGNDLPAIVTLDGAGGSSLTVPLDDITAVGLADFALANEQEAGVKDAFPRLFPR